MEIVEDWLGNVSGVLQETPLVYGIILIKCFKVLSWNRMLVSSLTSRTLQPLIFVSNFLNPASVKKIWDEITCFNNLVILLILLLLIYRVIRNASYMIYLFFGWDMHAIFILEGRDIFENTSMIFHLIVACQDSLNLAISSRRLAFAWLKRPIWNNFNKNASYVGVLTETDNWILWCHIEFVVWKNTKIMTKLWSRSYNFAFGLEFTFYMGG